MYYFEREGLYGYYDDVERFVVFSYVILESLDIIGFYLDIMYINDW